MVCHFTNDSKMITVNNEGIEIVGGIWSLRSPKDPVTLKKKLNVKKVTVTNRLGNDHPIITTPIHLFLTPPHT